MGEAGTRMHRNEDRWGESGEETERLVYFSDAVFAIAITLLVIDIRVPEMQAHTPVEEQLRQLLALWPKVLSYTISFLVVGSFWRAHHRIFGYIKRYDRRLIGLNLLLLLCVAFVPVPTAVLGDTGGELVPVAFYAGCIALTALAQLGVWWYASGKHRLVAPDLERLIIAYNTWRLVCVVLIFVLSIAIAFWSPGIAMASWALIVLVRSIVTRIFHRRARPTGQASAARR